MQRRAAAIYAVFFLVIAAGAYSAIGVAQEPVVSVDGQTLAQGDTLTVDGQTYTATSVGEGQGTLAWVNQSAEYTESWEATAQPFDPSPPTDADPSQNVIVDDEAPTTTVQGTDYRVVVQPAADPTDVYLIEAVSLSENVSTVMRDEVTYVVAEIDGSQQVLPAREYLRETHGEIEVREFSEGDTLEYQNQTVTVSAVENESVTVEWIAPRENTQTVDEGRQVTLGDAQYVAHFPAPDRVQLTTDIQGYEAELAVIDNYNERINGLWGISILSGMAAALIVGMAYMPSRY